MRLSQRFLIRCLVAALLTVISLPGFSAEKKTHFRVAWSIYAGWMPWAYADQYGIIDKWADKYGITIDVVRINDYIESINQYTLGEFDACGMTNMDALTIPAASGVDTTGLILGDYSNGNDAILLKDGKSMADIKGREVYLVELSVSHYLLARALDMNGLSERDVTLVNSSDADAASTYMADNVNAAAMWNPQLKIALDSAGDSTSEVFNSTRIPGEIIDMMAVKTDVLDANPDFAKALMGAWFETLALMQQDSPEAIEALTYMATESGTDLDGFHFQLDRTELFYTPESAHAFASNDQLRATMDKVRNFSFDKGLLGEGAINADAIGIAFSDGSVLGDKENIQLRFDSKFVKMAAEGKL